MLNRSGSGWWSVLVVAVTACAPEKGDAGPAGQQGPQGPQGVPGTVVVLTPADASVLIVDGGIAFVVGPQGPGGAQGPQGEQGPQGARGELTLLEVADGGRIAIDGGIVIVEGPVGPQGPAGPQGVPGVRGADGQSVAGVSVGATVDCPYGGVRYDSATGSHFVCNGAPGSVLVVDVADGGSLKFDGGLLVVAGPQGAVGPVGPQGDAGARGADGQSVTATAVGPSSQCPYGGVKYDSASGSHYVCNGAPGQVVVLAAADGGSLEVDGGLVIVSGPQGLAGVNGAVGATGATGAQGQMGPQGAAGPPGGVRILHPDGGLVGLMTSPTVFWHAAYECFIPPRSGALVVAVDFIEFDGPDCTGNAFYSGGTPSSTMNGAPPDLLMSCFYLPSTGPGMGRFGRMEHPRVAVSTTIRSVASRTVNWSGACSNNAPYTSPAYRFVDLPLNPATNAPFGIPNGFLVDAPR